VGCCQILKRAAAKVTISEQRELNFDFRKLYESLLSSAGMKNNAGHKGPPPSGGCEAPHYFEWSRQPMRIMLPKSYFAHKKKIGSPPGA